MPQQYFVQVSRPGTSTTQHIAPLSKCTDIGLIKKFQIKRIRPIKIRFWLRLCIFNVIFIVTGTGVTGAASTPIPSHQQQSHQMSQQLHMQTGVTQYVLPPRQQQVILNPKLYTLIFKFDSSNYTSGIFGLIRFESN